MQHSTNDSLPSNMLVHRSTSTAQHQLHAQQTFQQEVVTALQEFPAHLQAARARTVIHGWSTHPWFSSRASDERWSCCLGHHLLCAGPFTCTGHRPYPKPSHMLCRWPPCHGANLHAASLQLLKWYSLLACASLADHSPSCWCCYAVASVVL